MCYYIENMEKRGHRGGGGEVHPKYVLRSNLFHVLARRQSRVSGKRIRAIGK